VDVVYGRIFVASAPCLGRKSSVDLEGHGV
jgi:hypothetical protein